jgi:hypothetical protein
MALDNGAYWLRDERRHKAGELVESYQIRLSIAEHKESNYQSATLNNETTENLRFLVNHLMVDPERYVTCFVLRGSDILLYWLFEDEADGAYLGAITGNREPSIDAALKC